MELGKLIYKKIETDVFKFYACIFIIIIVVASIITLTFDAVTIKDILAPSAIIVSVSILFIQLNYNMYIHELERQEKKKEATFKVLYDMYISIKQDDFDEDDNREILTSYSDSPMAPDKNTFISNEYYLKDVLKTSKELKFKLQRMHNKLEFISGLYLHGQVDKTLLKQMLGDELIYWSKRFLLFKVATNGGKADNFLKLCKEEKYLDEEMINYIDNMMFEE